MASVASVTRQIAALEISNNKKPASTTARPPLHSKQPSQTNVAKLLTKFAAPNTTTVPSKSKSTASSSSLRTQPSAATLNEKPSTTTHSQQIDIGKYDGGLEIDNEKRGEIVSGDAAKELALDSSVAPYVFL